MTNRVYLLEDEFFIRLFQNRYDALMLLEEIRETGGRIIVGNGINRRLKDRYFESTFRESDNLPIIPDLVGIDKFFVSEPKKRLSEKERKKKRNKKDDFNLKKLIKPRVFAANEIEIEKTDADLRDIARELKKDELEIVYYAEYTDYAMPMYMGNSEDLERIKVVSPQIPQTIRPILAQRQPHFFVEEGLYHKLQELSNKLGEDRLGGLEVFINDMPHSTSFSSSASFAFSASSKVPPASIETPASGKIPILIDKFANKRTCDMSTARFMDLVYRYKIFATYNTDPQRTYDLIFWVNSKPYTPAEVLIIEKKVSNLIRAKNRLGAEREFQKIRQRLDRTLSGHLGHQISLDELEALNINDRKTLKYRKALAN